MERPLFLPRMDGSNFLFKYPIAEAVWENGNNLQSAEWEDVFRTAQLLTPLPAVCACFWVRVCVLSGGNGDTRKSFTLEDVFNNTLKPKGYGMRWISGEGDQCQCQCGRWCFTTCRSVTDSPEYVTPPPLSHVDLARGPPPGVYDVNQVWARRNGRDTHRSMRRSSPCSCWPVLASSAI